MSISRTFDEYLSERGIIPDAEVIPDNACQIFDLPQQVVNPSAADDIDAVAAQIQALFSS